MTHKTGPIERHRWVANLTIGGVEKGILRVFADYAGCDTLKCWPSIETIVSESGFCERTVQSAIDRLVSAKVIDIQPSRGRKPNIYLLRIPNPAADAPEPGKVTRTNNQGMYCSPGGERRSAFFVFYSAYPKKVARPKAEQVWKRKLLDPQLTAILADLEKRKNNGCWEEARFIPHPATYLNQERWRDEDDPPPTRHRGVVL